MLHEDLRVRCHRLAGDVVEDGVVEDDAVLQDLEERRSLMCVRPFQHWDEMRLHRVDRSRHEARAGAQREHACRHGILERSERRGRRAGAAA